MKNKINHTVQEFKWKTEIQEKDHGCQRQQEKNLLCEK